MVVPGGRPPAARMLAPATYDASSEQSHTITCAISSGVPCRCGRHHSSLNTHQFDRCGGHSRKEVRRALTILPSGIWPRSKVFAVSETMSVTVIPGDTVLMRMPPCAAACSPRHRQGGSPRRVMARSRSAVYLCKRADEADGERVERALGHGVEERRADVS